MEDIEFHQYNMSVMLMEKNGNKSSTNRKKHLRVRYLFFKNHIENGNLSLKYFPMGEMFADFFTKPLQREMFWRFWDMIQGVPQSTLYVKIIYPRTTAKVNSQECFGKNGKQTHRTSTARTVFHGSTHMDDHGRT